jgi:hypothetical protein
MSLIDVNDTTLHYERRGDGPAVLFVSGATGDAGHWTGVADVLASEYTVVTYDRRGNSRSPRPPGWTATTIDEQADDAAALLGGLEVDPVVFPGDHAGFAANPWSPGNDPAASPPNFARSSRPRRAPARPAAPPPTQTATARLGTTARRVGY